MMYRGFEIDSGLIAITGTTAVPALFVETGAAVDTNIVRIKVSVEAVAAPAPPSNGSVFFSLNKVTGTVGGGVSVTPTPVGPSPVPAAATWKSGSTALTGLTQGAEAWGGVVPFTSGAWAEDTYEHTGLEIYIPESGLYAFWFAAPSGAGSGCSARVIAWATE